MPYKFETAKILIVDDMAPMLTLTKSLLNTFGCKDVFTASSGKQGFDVFCKESPDLVITDWVMEEMDGLEMIEMIRKNHLSPNRYVPIIIMSGYSSKIRVEKARDLGVTEFLVKPYTASDMFAKIEHVIERPRRFVECDVFFGPDRRRKRSDGYSGPKRREDDENADKNIIHSATDAQTADKLKHLVDETRKRLK